MCELVATGIAEAQREVNRMSELKPCPYRVHGERVRSLTVEGEYYYNEVFMPCMKKKCLCFHRDGDDAYRDDRENAIAAWNRRAEE